MASNPSRIRIVEDRCVGCGLCVKACPFGALQVVDRKAVMDFDRCTLCGACIPACAKFEAIEGDLPVRAGRREPAGDVWVFCEQEGERDRLTPAALELLGLGRKLADTLGVKMAGVVLGNEVENSISEVIGHGADTVYVTCDPSLARFDDQRYAVVLSHLLTDHHPEILLGGATAVGRALLPRVAVMVHTGLTADCTELSIDEESGLLLQTRPAFGGNILATITCEGRRPQMATVRPGVLRRPEPDPERRGRVIRCTPPPFAGPSPEWLAFVPRGGGGVDLHGAEIIVSAGYGVGGPEGCKLVSRLAHALGATLGASRAVVDAGWTDYARQVGQTGTTVQPRLYVACGISGAIQHVVGMQNSGTVVAINRDPDAPIFNYADFAVVGDLFEIVPCLIRQIEEAVPAGGRQVFSKTVDMEPVA